MIEVFLSCLQYGVSVNLQVREILSEIRNKEVIAEGSSVKIRKRLEELYGIGLKLTASVRKISK